MALKLYLKPRERVIINGAMLRNGERRTEMHVETDARVLRETDIVLESEADTAAKRLYTTLMVIYLVDNPAEAITLFYAQSTEVLRRMPGAAPHLLAIRDAVDAGTFYPALKAGKKLIAYEADLDAAGRTAAA